jgi:hypothetical protein
MKKILDEGNQIQNFISSSGSGTVIKYGSGSGSDFLTSYSSSSGSGSTSQKVTVPTVPVPVPQHCLWAIKKKIRRKQKFFASLKSMKKEVGVPIFYFPSIGIKELSSTTPIGQKITSKRKNYIVKFTPFLNNVYFSWFKRNFFSR